MKLSFLFICTFLIAGCGNQSCGNQKQKRHLQHQTPCDSVIIPIQSFIKEITESSLWQKGAYNEPDSTYLDWRQIIEYYRASNYPKSKHLFLSLDEDDSFKFNITQPPRPSDIHYIDTMLMLTYSCSSHQLAAAFNRELEKYLSQPITFQETLPLFENSQGENDTVTLFNLSPDGIFVMKTPDKKYKIYSYDDNTGGTGRNYCTYIQYLKNGKTEWRKLPDGLPQIRKIYAFKHQGFTYYAIISFQRNFGCSWTEFFNIVTLEDGEIIPHPEFYPHDIQNRLYTIYDRETRRKELTEHIIKECLGANEQNVADVVEECLNEEEAIARANIDEEKNHTHSILFSNLQSGIDIDVDFDPKNLSVSYNDVIYTGGEEGQYGLYKTIDRKRFQLNTKD